jgi:hypothetical protein
MAGAGGTDGGDPQKGRIRIAAREMTMADDKSSLFTRPDGRLRAAFIVPAALVLLLVIGLIWQFHNAT